MLIYDLKKRENVMYVCIFRYIDIDTMYVCYMCYFARCDGGVQHASTSPQGPAGDQSNGGEPASRLSVLWACQKYGLYHHLGV